MASLQEAYVQNGAAENDAPSENGAENFAEYVADTVAQGGDENGAEIGAAEEGGAAADHAADAAGEDAADPALQTQGITMAVAGPHLSRLYLADPAVFRQTLYLTHPTGRCAAIHPALCALCI